MTSTPSLAIIIVNWNSFDVTENCLASLREVDYQNYEIVVVDNGSKDESGDQLKSKFPEITLLKNENNLGFTGGNNTGIRYALNQRKQLIMLLNNDTVVTPPFATNLVKVLIEDLEIGAIQPKIMFNRERNIIWNAGTKFSKTWFKTSTIGSGQEDRSEFDQTQEIPWVTGCCFLTKASVIDAIGLLDDRFFIYYEDADWSFRMRKEGYRLIYEPNAKIFHEVGKSNENRDTFGEGNLSPFSHYMNIRNHLFLLRKHSAGPSVLTAYFYQFYKILGYSLYFLGKRRFRKLMASYKGVYDGFLKPL